MIFPEYVASTEYYHRLHTEALVYENYDFNMLHRVRSNEEVIKEKNKQLIPVFNQIKLKIKHEHSGSLMFLNASLNKDEVEI